MPKRWTIGITHLIKPPFDPELAAFDGGAEIVHFDTRHESELDPQRLSTLDALLVWTPTITAHSIAHLGNCKIVVRYGVGYDKVDRDALKQQSIAFSNNPEYGPEDVADTAVAMLLSLQRRIIEHDRRARDYRGSWQENHLSPVVHSPLCATGIIGVGRIGISVANRLKACGHTVLGYDPYVSNGMFRAIGIERVHTLAELVARVDMLSVHCPLTDETRAMIDRQLMAQAKPGLVFVNTARGAIVESLDVVEQGLRSGQLSGAGLDVLPLEPPDDHPLIIAWREDAPWLRGRLLITPHNAFYSDHSMHESRYEAARTAQLYLDQGIHRNAIEQ